MFCSAVCIPGVRVYTASECELKVKIVVLQESHFHMENKYLATTSKPRKASLECS